MRIDLSRVAAGQGGFVVQGTGVSGFFGTVATGVGDLDGDGFADLAFGGDGLIYVLYGAASGFGAPIDPATIAAGQGGFAIRDGGPDAAPAEFLPIFSVAGGGDVNGDGLADLLLGNGDIGPDATRFTGVGYLLPGAAEGEYGPVFDPDDLPQAGGTTFLGIDRGDNAGIVVASAGDINGDGLDDMLFAAPNSRGANNVFLNAGEVYVVFGAAGGLPAEIPFADIAAGQGGFVIEAERSFGTFGSAVSSASDVNGDGYDDILIGGQIASVALGAPSVFVVFGGPDGFGSRVDLDDIAAGQGGFGIVPERPTDLLGLSVAPAGDVNGDGIADMVIGARSANLPGTVDPGPGAVYVVFGRAEGFVGPVDLDQVALGQGGFVLRGVQSNVPGGTLRLGFEAAGIGDANGDGLDDILVGTAPGSTVPTAGYLVFGRADGFGDSVDLTTLAGGDDGVAFDGTASIVSAAGDVNGDGLADLLLSERFTSHVVFGRDFDGLTLTHRGGLGADVLDGTAGDDRIVAGAGNDLLRTGAGGEDALSGGAGDDTMEAAHLDFRRLDGGAGTDLLRLAAPGMVLDLGAIPDLRLRGFEAIDLGSGGNGLRLTRLEVLNLSDTSNALTVTGVNGFVDFADAGWMQGATAGGLTTFTQGLATVQVSTRLGLGLQGGTGGDTLTGGAGGDSLSGAEGADSLFGGQGVDTLLGGAGNDTLTGGQGADLMDGGAGDDVYVVSGADAIVDTSGIDTVLAAQSHALGTTLENLTLTGSAVANGVGNEEANRLTGNSAANLLRGLQGADSLSGVGGDDTLVGGQGADTLAGGAGADAYRFVGPGDGGDSILGYAGAADRLEVSAGGFGGGLVAGMDLVAAGRYVENAAGAATAAVAQFVFDTNDQVLFFDADGTGAGEAVEIADLAGATGWSGAEIVVIA